MTNFDTIDLCIQYTYWIYTIRRELYSKELMVAVKRSHSKAKLVNLVVEILVLIVVVVVNVVVVVVVVVVVAARVIAEVIALVLE